jgi:hypothetical protein
MIFAICFQFGDQKSGKWQRKFLEIGNGKMFISSGEIPQKKIFRRRKSNLKKKTNKMIFSPLDSTKRKSNFPDWLGVKFRNTSNSPGNPISPGRTKQAEIYF